MVSVENIFFSLCFSAVGPTFVFILSDIHNSVMIQIFRLVYYRNCTCLCFSFVWWLLLLVFFLVFFQVCRQFLLCFSWEKGLHFLSSVFQSRQLKSDFSISVLWFRFFVPFYPRSIFNIQHSMHQCFSSSTLDVCFTEVLNSFLLIFSRYRLSTGLEWLKKN